MKVNSYTLFTSGGESRRYGVGFFASENLSRKLLNFEAVLYTMCFIQFRDPVKKTVINVYAPTEETTEEKKDILYEQLEEL